MFYRKKRCGRKVEGAMKIEALLGLPEGLEVVDGDVANQVITLTIISTQQNPSCPLCGRSASRVHSHYRRQVTDMSCAGQRVRFILHVRKFLCDEQTCGRKIFTERLVPFIQPWARVTTRFFQAIEDIGLATSGMLGARLGARLGMPVSWMTILRRMMARPSVSVERVVELGLDDFSFKRGRKFGTILVDLQSHQVIDLLPDRAVETVSAWMRAHPEIRLVSRDRAGDYASAATAAAPQAKQCADRFHLIQNLGEALEGVLARHLAAHRRNQAEKSRAVPLSDVPPKLSSKAVELSRAKREARLAQYQQVVALREQGFSQTAIAEQVGIGHATVSRWLRHGSFPEQKPRPRSASVDPHLSQLVEQWKTGSHTIAELHRELVAKGYSHRYNSVYRRLARSFPEGQKKRFTRSAPSGQLKQEAPDQLPHPPVLARQAAFLFLRQAFELSTEEQETLAWLRSLHTEVNLAYELVQQFAHMLRTRTGEHLDDWLCRVKASQIRELQGFLAGVKRDKAAVVAGLTLPQNNGVVEGNVNKLKLIKRMMYGRAKLPLLRQRVLHAL
jgi:transposase